MLISPQDLEEKQNKLSHSLEDAIGEIERAISRNKTTLESELGKEIANVTKLINRNSEIINRKGESTDKAVEANRKTIDAKVAALENTVKVHDADQARILRRHREIEESFTKLTKFEVAEALEQVKRIDLKLEEHFEFHKFPLVRKQNAEVPGDTSAERQQATTDRQNLSDRPAADRHRTDRQNFKTRTVSAAEFGNNDAASFS